MTRHVKVVGLLAAIATLAVCAATAAAASAAPQWKIKGAAFTGSETLSTSGGPFVLESKVGAEKITIKCEHVSSEGAEIKENKKDFVKVIIFSSCTVVTPSSCTVTTSIRTIEVLTELVEESSKLYDVFTPVESAKGVFTTIDITGCALAGEYKVKGTARGLLTKGTGESVEQPLEFSKTTGSKLTFGGEEATLTGTAELALSGTHKGEVWGG